MIKTIHAYNLLPQSAWADRAKLLLVLSALLPAIIISPYSAAETSFYLYTVEKRASLFDQLQLLNTPPYEVREKVETARLNAKQAKSPSEREYFRLRALLHRSYWVRDCARAYRKLRGYFEKVSYQLKRDRSEAVMHLSPQKARAIHAHENLYSMLTSRLQSSRRVTLTKALFDTLKADRQRNQHLMASIEKATQSLKGQYGYLKKLREAIRREIRNVRNKL